MKRLKALDRRLDCTFYRATGRFAIVFKRPHGDIAVFDVRSEAGGFRQPDEREIMALKECDMQHSNETLNERLTKRAYAMELYQRRQRQKSKQLIRELTVDNKIQFANVFSKATGTSKGNSAFRRI